MSRNNLHLRLAAAAGSMFKQQITLNYSAIVTMPSNIKTNYTNQFFYSNCLFWK